MRVLRSIDAFYPHFPIGGEPGAVPCKLCLVESNGRKYLQTPFAFLDAHADDDPERQIALGHYYATREDCDAYLAGEYPHWKRMAPLMNVWAVNRYHHGPIVGDGRTADHTGVSVFQIAQYARGHRSISLKNLKAALAALAQPVA